MAANLSERMDCGRNIAKVRSASKAASQSNVQMHSHVAKTLSPLVYRIVHGGHSYSKIFRLGEVRSANAVKSARQQTSTNDML